MKKIYNLFVVLAAVMLIAACGKESNPYQEPDKTIEVVATDVVFGPEGGNGEVEFTASGTVGVVSNRDWCTASVAGTKVNVTVTEWEGVETRYAILTLKCGAYSVDVTVQQNGTILGGLTGAEIVADSKGTTQVFEVKVSGSVTTSSAVDWASVSYVDGVVTVTVDANADPATRFGEVTVAAGENSHSISIKQYPEFKTTASWTLSYDGRARSSSGTLYEVISNEVEAGSSEGLYFLTMSSEAAYKASKIKKLDDFIAAVAAEAEEEIAYLVEYYTMFGYEVTPADFMYEDSDYDFFAIQEPGKYYAVAAGYDEEGYPTGLFSYSEFEVIEVKNAEGWNAEYAGPYVAGSTVYDMVDFTAGDEDSYYAVVMDSESYEKYYYSDITNLINDYVPYIIETQPTLRTGNKTLYYSKFSNGTWLTVMIGFDSEYNPTGKYFVGAFKIDEKPTEAYKAWLGDWQITTPRVQNEVANYDVWTIEQGLVNGSYFVNNFGGHPTSFGWTVTLNFNATTNEISCDNGQVVGPDGTSSGATYTPTLLAKVLIGTSNYRFTGTFTVFTGVINSDGDIELTPGTVNYQGAKQTITGVQLYGIKSSGASYWRTETPLPNVLKPYEGDSAPKKANAYLNLNAFTESYEPAAEMPYLMEAPVVEVAEAASKAVATKRLAVKADKQYRRK